MFDADNNEPYIKATLPGQPPLILHLNDPVEGANHRESSGFSQALVKVYTMQLPNFKGGHFYETMLFQGWLVFTLLHS